MGMDISIEADTGRYYYLDQRLLISLFSALDLYCAGDQDYQYINVIEPFFDHQACVILGPIIDAYYYAPDRDYTETDFERYVQNNLPRSDGIAWSEEEFLETVHHIKTIWRNVDDYISVIKRLIPAIGQLHSRDQDPIGRYGPSVLKELLDTLELAIRDGALQIRVAFI